MRSSFWATLKFPRTNSTMHSVCTARHWITGNQRSKSNTIRPRMRCTNMDGTSLELENTMRPCKLLPRTPFLVRMRVGCMCIPMCPNKIGGLPRSISQWIVRKSSQGIQVRIGPRVPSRGDCAHNIQNRFGLSRAWESRRLGSNIFQRGRGCAERFAGRRVLSGGRRSLFWLVGQYMGQINSDNKLMGLDQIWRFSLSIFCGEKKSCFS